MGTFDIQKIIEKDNFFILDEIELNMLNDTSIEWTYI